MTTLANNLVDQFSAGLNPYFKRGYLRRTFLRETKPISAFSGLKTGGGRKNKAKQSQFFGGPCAWPGSSWVGVDGGFRGGYNGGEEGLIVLWEWLS